jgi:hypothetical protein
MIKEEFLHYIWQTLKFNTRELKTTAGSSVTLLENGLLNPNAGPDFIGARINLNDILWIGNVEIHIRSVDWKKHGHHLDKNYNNVILHVVLEEDEPAYSENGNRLPCVELKGRIDKNALRNYRLLQNKNSFIPCLNHITDVPEIYLKSALESAVIERFTLKAERFRNYLNQFQNDWEFGFFILLARNFGVPVNADAFEKMAISIPPMALRKERFQLKNLEALFFGQAGFLTQELDEDYGQELNQIYQFQQLKYQLKPMAFQHWKFMRMRPGNFPSIRLAQLAALIHKHDSFVDHIKNQKGLEAISGFMDAEVSEFWKNHYRFNNTSVKLVKKTSSAFKNLLLINVIAVYYLTLGLEKQDNHFIERSTEILTLLKPEKNKFIRQWEKFGIVPASAFESQGLLGLYLNKCTRKRCLDCPVGRYILNRD